MIPRSNIGAAAGLIAAIVCLLLTIAVMGEGWPSFLPRLSLDWSVVLGVLLFPAFLVLLAVITARLTVIRELSRNA